MKGIIRSVKKDKTSIKVDDTWYTLKEQALISAKNDEDLYGYEIYYVPVKTEEANKNDHIIFYNKLDKRVYPKKEIEKRVNNSNQDVDWDGKDRRMVRMNCLTQANTMVNTIMQKENNITSNKIQSLILNHAELFENWIYRDQAHKVSVESSSFQSNQPKPQNANGDEGGEGLSPLPSSSNNEEVLFEYWTTYKKLNPDGWSVKALWVDFAIKMGISQKDLLRVWDENVGSNN